MAPSFSVAVAGHRVGSFSFAMAGGRSACPGFGGSAAGRAPERDPFEQTHGVRSEQRLQEIVRLVDRIMVLPAQGGAVIVKEGTVGEEPFVDGLGVGNLGDVEDFRAGR